MKLFKRFLSDDKGLETVEYAIIAGLIVVALIAIVTAIGTKIRDRFQSLNDHL